MLYIFGTQQDLTYVLLEIEGSNKTLIVKFHVMAHVFSYFSTKISVVDTLKNSLTQSICYNPWIKNINNLMCIWFSLSILMGLSNPVHLSPLYLLRQVNA